MKIHYKPKRLYAILFLSLLWMPYVLSDLIIDKSFQWKDFAFSLWALVFIGIYIFEKRNQYLTITKTEIQKNTLVPQKLKLKDIVAVKKFAGDYILKTPSKELKINTKTITDSSLIKLDELIEGLNL